LRDGNRLSQAMASLPNQFPPLLVGLIRAAEGTSDLHNAVSRYIAYQETVDSVRTRVSSALIYPVILLVAGAAITVFLLAYVVPRFAVVYQSTGRDLPAMSAALLAWGRLVAAHSAPLAIGFVTSVTSVILCLRWLVRKHGWGAIIHRVPGLGKKLKSHEQARFYLTLGTLLESGIAIVPALSLVAEVSTLILKARLLDVIQAVRSGQSLSDALEMQKMTSPVSLRLLRVGERSGKLGDMLLRSASFQDGEVMRWLDRFTRIFEPAVMAVIGMIIGTIVILLYMPIFDLAGTVQ
jgi:general secretion pathway protein F